MAVGGDIVEQVSNNVFGILFSGSIVIVGILLLCAVIVGVALYVRYIRQFNIFVEILSLRSTGTSQGNTNKIIFDKGALIYDKKDKSWYFRLLSYKIDLPTPPFNVLQNSTKGNVLRILQKSNEEFVYLMPDVIDQYNIVDSEGKVIPIATLTLKQVEGDVSYWNQIRKRTNRKLFDTESLIMKLLPYLVPLLMFMLVIFMTWIIVKNFNVLESVARELRITSEILKSTTTPNVITG